MARVKVTPQQIETIKQLAAEGKTLKEIAALTGVSDTTCWRYVQAAKPAPGAAPAAADPAPTGDSAADRLKRASSAAGPDPDAVPEPGPGFGSAGATPEANDAKLAEGLVAFSDFVNVATCRLYAASKKVKVAPKMLKDWAYTKEEKDFMLGMAPYAVPYVKIILEKLPVLMAIGYGGAHVWLTAQRLNQIDELAPPPPPKPEEK